MAGRFPRSAGFVSLPRTGLRVGVASMMLIAASATSVHNATADGDTRELSFHHTHSDESLTIVFKRNGRYDEGALKKLNHFLRDWRSQDSTTMDRRLFDILWEVNRDVDGKQPIKIISAYRSPATNAMLRRRSSGVARFSQHMQGHAIDFFIPGVPLEQVRFAGLRLQRGGVGFYPTSGSPFVHLDVGSIRHWPRMNHDQLARVFPNGRTVHVPSDGRPLAGYQLALADIEKRGDTSEAPSKSKGLIASLFGRKPTEDEEEVAPGASPDTKPGLKPASLAAVASKAEKPADAIPMPRAKPASSAATYQVASATSQPALLAKPKATTAARMESPVDIINARGFWDNEPTAPKPTTSQVATLKAREAVASADPQPTASLNSNVSLAMAYAPPTPPLDKSQIVAASAPIPRSIRASSLAASPMSAPVPGVNETTIAKGQAGGAATIVRIAAWQMNEIWLRAMILTPNASTSLSAAILGDQDMTVMRTHFVKPRASVAMTFSNDPQMGLVCDRFTGSAIATLQTMTFGLKTAALR